MRRAIGLDSPARGVWRLAQTRPIPVNSYLIEDGDSLILIDAGNRGRPGELLRAVQAVAASTGKHLAAIALTHGHQDHVGGLAEVVAAHSVPVYAHPEAIPRITGARSYASLPAWWGYMRRGWAPAPSLPPGTELRPLGDGERLGPLQARHTPGHTPGHLAFFHAGVATWFAGDVLMYNARVLSGPLWFWTCDIAQVRRSAARLLEPAAVAAICLGHGAVFRQLERLQTYLHRYGMPLPSR